MSLNQIRIVLVRPEEAGNVGAAARVDTRDPALIIFTTGSTGSPKPAMLCHESILIQNIGLGEAFEFGGDRRGRDCGVG